MTDTAAPIEQSPLGLAGPDWFAAALSRHGGIVRKVAWTYCRNAADRADLTQDILAHAIAASHRYDPARPFATWLYRIALNVAISQVRAVYRQERVMVPLEDDHARIAADPVDHEQRDARAVLDAAMQALDPLNRAMLLLYLDERSQREIAEIMGLSPSNVGTKIARLKRDLRDRLGLAEPEGDDA
jgi:RNA polymerase sigma-70 factor (ECF subfamily)